MADEDLVTLVVYGTLNFGIPLLFVIGLWIQYCCQRQETAAPPRAPTAGEMVPPSSTAAAIARLDGVTYVRPQQQIIMSADEAAAEDGSGDGEYDCAIYLGAFEDGDLCSVMPGCRHEFHRACIAGWLKARNRSTCPLCRARLQWPALGAQDMV